MARSSGRVLSRRAWGSLVLLGVLGLSALTAAPAGTLPTVASTDLCADMLLLRIGASEQIVSMSRQGRDRRLSAIAEAARAYPANRGTVEDLLYLKPDIALVNRGWGAKRHADLLNGRGVRLISLPYPKTWADTLATARRVAAEIGRGEVGEARVADAERRMAKLAARTRPLRVLYLRPSGGTAGAGTYVDDLIRRMGLRNLAAERGYTGWGRFPLEQLVLSPPDVFLLGYFGQTTSMADAAYGRHPLLRAILARVPTLAVPSENWGCGGLELVEAAERIAAGIERLDLGSGPRRIESRMTSRAASARRRNTNESE